jgi:hypothetical protein
MLFASPVCCMARQLYLSVSLLLTIASLPKAVAGSQVSIGRIPNGGIQPQVLTDREGTLHLLYYAGDPAHGDLYYVRSSNAGHTWSSPLRVNSKPGSAIALGTIRGGQIAIGRHGRIFVAWNGSSRAEPAGLKNPESGQNGAPMLYARLNDAHAAFEPERNLMTRTFGLDGGGTIAADASGHVYVAWHAKVPGAAPGEAGRQVWITSSNDDGKTFTGERPATDQPTGACGCCGMAMYSDSNGTLRALYRSATQDVHRDIYLLTSRDQAHTFSVRKLDTWNINACPMSSMAFAEGTGIVAGAWETAGQVYFENPSDTNAKPVSAPGSSESHKQPRLSIAASGKTLLAWTEGTGWNRGGAVAWQMYDAREGLTADKGKVAGVPPWSFAAVAATSHGFLILY